MTNTVSSQPVPSTISDVERDTGVAKETLRVWERRYDFPQPLRDPNGERVYPIEQVQKLRLVKRLIDLGFRPGKVIQFSTAELQALTGKAAAGNGPVAPAPELQTYLDLCKSHQMEAMRRKLSQALLMMGLKSFVIELVAPLTALIGEAWASGQLATFEEHLYTESLTVVMRSAIFAMPQANANNVGAPRILLTTLPQERHGLGLLMAEAMCVAEGAHCISLGVQTPLLDIVEAARVQRVDIIALSFSVAMNPRQVLDGLAELHTRLAGCADLWAGGNNAALKRRKPAYVRVFELADLAKAIGEWRTRHAGLPAG
ncbi:MerR family transcriptional regulator [Pseudoduganella sp. FT25W]|jgi:DNA-binding transcriptional MerR regulator/methylmalonyl-CoA mutase cobalamin-binding subunit|uniref:MerR family transcriptional regulator n=1 Tax=Duganella alba TaxID=2666081 RepID=A0A6L5QED7_9BURK|nr:MerR family transcriptional regulator [Duganella alba]MRX07908.1 MerR family transcriptional regulator [Duganella alba]MRX15511.1 MerR family transcriptional regulator [Duganella alba]